MFREIILSQFVIILLFMSVCLSLNHDASFRRIKGEDRDADDSEDFGSDDDDYQTQLDSHLSVQSSTPLTTSTTPAAPACQPQTVEGRLPHRLSSLRTSGGGSRDNWRVRLDWVLDRASDSPSDGFVSGSIATISGRVGRTLQVLPTSSAGCDNPAVFGTAAAAAAEHDCEVALSAGGTGACPAVLIGNGHAAMDSSWSERSASTSVNAAHFGITNTGHAFFGYLNNRLGRSENFTQLVSGLGWLVRDGKNFVSQSLQLECSPTEPVSRLAAAAAALSARVAVGQKRSGELVLVHIIGRSALAGLTLTQFSDLLIKLGVVNAINLDVGDAAALVVNDTLVGSPSASCGDPALPLTCLRPTSTILCLKRNHTSSRSLTLKPLSSHVTSTNAPSEHLAEAICADGLPCNRQGGRCDHDSGHCACRPDYSGAACSKRRCLCLNHGLCQQENSGKLCLCQPGYTGELCERSCPPGLYGQGCRRVCVCAGGQSDSCDPINGTCGGVAGKPGNESSLLRSIQDRLQGMGSLNLALISLCGVATLSMVLNFCILVSCCRARCRRCRHAKQEVLAGARGKRYQPLRMVPSGRESGSDQEAAMM